VEDAFERFFDARAEAVGRIERLVSRLAGQGSADLASLTVAVRQIRNAVAQ
jgi:NAD-specific glutamate dehydrogenase